MTATLASVKAAGLAVLRRRLAELPLRARAEANVALARIGDEVTDEMRRSLQSATPVSSSGAMQPASAPGGPPRDPTGDLAASLTAMLDQETSRVTVASASPHAVLLEYGTRRMAARPFLRPAVAATLATARQHCRDAIARAAAGLREGS